MSLPICKETIFQQKDTRGRVGPENCGLDAVRKARRGIQSAVVRSG